MNKILTVALDSGLSPECAFEWHILYHTFIMR